MILNARFPKRFLNLILKICFPTKLENFNSLKVGKPEYVAYGVWIQRWRGSTTFNVHEIYWSRRGLVQVFNGPESFGCGVKMMLGRSRKYSKWVKIPHNKVFPTIRRLLGVKQTLSKSAM